MDLLVIDIQCIMNANNVLIPKEIVVVSMSDDYIGHWIIAPPHTSKTLQTMSKP